MKPQLIELLHTGAENARTSRELAQSLGWDNTRDVTQEVHSLRVGGSVICSSTGENPGYFLPANIREVADFCKQMNSRIREIESAKLSAERMLVEMGGES